LIPSGVRGSCLSSFIETLIPSGVRGSCRAACLKPTDQECEAPAETSCFGNRRFAKVFLRKPQNSRKLIFSSADNFSRLFSSSHLGTVAFLLRKTFASLCFLEIKINARKISDIEKLTKLQEKVKKAKDVEEVRRALESL